MSNKHTPNEWLQSHRKIPNDQNGMYATQIYTEDGETIATVHWYPKPPENVIFEGKKAIKRGTYRDANAQLISAAPNLLEACQAMLKAFQDAPKEWLMTNDVMQAESIMIDAVNKAVS